ncbi:MMPL family transporter [Luteimonas pelagia]
MSAHPGGGRRLALAFAWLVLLVAAGAWLGQRLSVSGDLRAFMPDARTPDQRLLLDELGEGPGARLLLVALSGASPERLAAISNDMVGTLSASPRFALVANGGEAGLDTVPGALRPYRYLLSPTLDTQAFDAAFLRAQLDARLQDLGSPVAGLVEPLVPADPTLETLVLAESWSPAAAPQRLHGTWFDTAGQRALLVAQTTAAGFDPEGQRAAVDALRTAFEEARGDDAVHLSLGGPGAYSVEIGGRTAAEARRIGTIDSLVFVLLLALAYRSWKAPLLGGLPLASGGLAGLAAVALGFETVHGITIAFGFTLIGVAQDYPIHFFSHLRPGVAPRDSVRALWPALRTGVVATCIAYATFLVSGVDGLEQLAWFTVVGLGVASLATRFVLPALVDPVPRDPADSPFVQRAWRALSAWRRPPAAAFVALAALAAGVVAFAPGATWQNDLSKLTPAPAELVARDMDLRAQLGAPDVRYMVVVPAADAESALQASEALAPALAGLQARGALGGFDMAARYLPSARVQRERQARLPRADALQASLADAVAGTPFREDVFAPFLADVATARDAAPLRAEDLAGTPLAQRIDGLLIPHGDGVAALVSLQDLRDPAALARAVEARGARLLDLKAASESLVADYRQRVLWALGLAALLLAATVWAALRTPRRTLRVLAPMALTTLVVLAVLRAAGVELSLFHLVALILAAGLGLDYALFFDHAGDDRDDQLRTLHAVLVCAVITFAVFALLATSDIPVLRAIGGTVALGVLSNFVLALLVVRRPVAGERHAHA